jgi:hypothetical protein
MRGPNAQAKVRLMTLRGLPPVPVLCFATIAFSRIVHGLALRRLSAHDELRLNQASSGTSLLIRLGVIAAIANLHLLMLRLDALSIATVLAIYLPAAVVFWLVAEYVVHHQLRALGLPPAFLCANVMAGEIVALGFAAMLLAL